MLNKMRRARADLATMNALFPQAERIAHADGIDQPGAEHLLLAALDLDDGVATAALQSFDVDAAALGAAIVEQHDEALRSVGVIADDNALAAALPDHDEARGPYRARGSLSLAFQRAIALAKQDRAALNSGYLLLAIVEAERGTVARALEHLGIDRTLLRNQTSKLQRR